MAKIDTVNLAVLVDADNAQPTIISGLMAEIAKYGTANVKRIYGDWTTPGLKGWKDVLLKYSIQPIQQFSYTYGKNSTDSAMIIDAMDLLYTDKFDGFCIVSSDSDFTKLASRIREAGLIVYGFGERKTPEPFVAACDKFIYTELLRFEDDDEEEESIRRKSANELKRDTKLVRLLRNALEASSDESGWAHLATVGRNIANQTPEFDPRNYGYKKLGELIRATKLFEIDERREGDNRSAVIYIKDKRKKDVTQLTLNGKQV
ncbi:MAG: hypothetical protein IEMM0003_0203 [bacterium]|nr:MAG: hypothetical protein IEMM0003_0203 [bacterium]